MNFQYKGYKYKTVNSLIFGCTLYKWNGKRWIKLTKVPNNSTKEKLIENIKGK